MILSRPEARVELEPWSAQSAIPNRRGSTPGGGPAHGTAESGAARCRARSAQHAAVPEAATRRISRIIARGRTLLLITTYGFRFTFGLAISDTDRLPSTVSYSLQNQKAEHMEHSALNHMYTASTIKAALATRITAHMFH